LPPTIRTGNESAIEQENPPNNMIWATMIASSFDLCEYPREHLLLEAVSRKSRIGLRFGSNFLNSKQPEGELMSANKQGNKERENKRTEDESDEQTDQQRGKAQRVGQGQTGQGQTGQGQGKQGEKGGKQSDR
jgi:hypothetical protein